VARQNYGVKLRYIAVDGLSIRRPTRKDGLSWSWHWCVSSGRKETHWGRKGSLVRLSLPLYIVHRALIDSVLHPILCSDRFNLMHNISLQFYNDDSANNRYKFNLSIIAWILHILHRLDEYKRVASFRNIHSTTFELIISKLFFLKYQQIDIATYIIHIYWRKYQLFSLSNFYSAEWFLSILKDFEGKLWKKIFKNFILCWKFYQNNLSGFQNFWKKQNIP